MILLFFPIYLELDFHYDVNRRKLGFVVYLFKFFKLIGGYISTYVGGLAAHLTEEKAVIIPYAQLDGERKKFSFLKTFRLKTLNITMETGAEYLLPAATLHALLRGYFFAIGGKKEHIENNLWLTDGDLFRISSNCVLFFNGYILLKNFIKFLKEKMKILWRKKMKGSTV